MKADPKDLLNEQHLRAVRGALPECRISLYDLDERVGGALEDYATVAGWNEVDYAKPAERRKLRKDLLACALKLKQLMKSQEFRAATMYGGSRPPLEGQQLSEFIDWLEVAEKQSPKRARGGLKDEALDTLIMTLADIYRDASGGGPTSSRNGSDPLPHGPWIDFFFAAVEGDTYPVRVQSQGIVVERETFVEAFDTRWRRLVRPDQQSKK